MQSAGDLVVGRIEFSACIELGKHHLNGGHLLTVCQHHHVDGDTAAIVNDGDRVVDVDGDFDFLGMTGEGFVDGIVYYFVNKMVKSHLTGRANVHGWAKSYV